MVRIKIADTTLCQNDSSFSFKEKLEIARQLERLNVDAIEISEIKNAKTDILFIKTVASFVKKSVISVGCGIDMESIENAIAALSNAEHPRVRIELPVSPVCMEYTCHKKPAKMLEWIKAAVSTAKEKIEDVEFCAVDATRAEKDFLESAIKTAVQAGASTVTVCDSAAQMLPDDFARFIDETVKATDGVSVGVSCDNKNGLACANAILSVKHGATVVKTAVGSQAVSLETFVDMVKNCGDNYGFQTDTRYTELHRIVNQINWITQNVKSNKAIVSGTKLTDEEINLDAKDDQTVVAAAVAKLGYDLSEEDNAKVYEEFLRVAEKKNVGAKELEAIVASVALQVPATYKLISYVINNGNIISASAQIVLSKDGKEMPGVSMGDGPIDAAFLAIDQIIGHHYELDDFQIQSVTEGKEAMGSALVKLRSGGKLYSGNGISTDIIGASIRAYINAVNKIVYEEA